MNKVINVRYIFQVIKTEVLTDEVQTYLEVTQEQFDRIKVSYETGKFTYMTDDKNLKDIIVSVIEEGEEDGRRSYGEYMSLLKVIVVYPYEIAGDSDMWAEENLKVYNAEEDAWVKPNK